MTLSDNYVYCFTNTEDSIVYIGRGVGDRIDCHYSKHAHNAALQNAIDRDQLTHSFLAINITEEQAIAVESFAIIQYEPIFNKSRGSNTQDFFKPCVNTIGSRKNRAALNEMKRRTIDFFKPFKETMGEEAWFKLVERLYDENHIDSWKTFNQVMAAYLGVEYTQLVTNEERYGRNLDDRETGLINNRLARIREYMDEKELSHNERKQLEAQYWSYINQIGIDVFVDGKKTKMADIWKGIGVIEDRSNSGRRSGHYKGDISAGGKVFTSIDAAEKYYGLSSGTGRLRIKSTTFPDWFYVNWCGNGKDPSNTKVTGTAEAKKVSADAARKSKRWWKHQGKESIEKYLLRLEIWKNLEWVYNFWQEHCQGLGSMRFNKELQSAGFKYESKKFYEKLINLLRNHHNTVEYENGLTEYEAAIEEMKSDPIQNRIDKLTRKSHTSSINN